MYKIINILILLSLSGMVMSQFNAGQIGNDQVICYGSAPLKLNFSTPPSGGTLPYNFRWQRSNDLGASWADISGTTAAMISFSPPTLGKTTLFRCRVSDAASNVVTTNIVTITVSLNLNAGIIGNNQTIYSGTIPNPLTPLTPASGGGGSYTYQWQTSTNGLNWINIQGATSASHSPTATLTEAWFRRFVNDVMCGSSASNSIRVSITPITLYTTEIPTTWRNYVRFELGTEFQCLADGFITKVRLYSHVNEGGIHQIRIWRQTDQLTYELIAGPFNWDFSTGATGWRDYSLLEPINVRANRNYIVSITNGEGNQYWVQTPTFTPVTTNNYIRYLRGLLGGSIGSVPNDNNGEGYFRDVEFVPFSPGAAGLSDSICYNSTPNPLTETIQPSGAAGNYLYNWQSSPDNLVWTNIQGATSPNYSSPALTINTYFRRGVTSGGLTAFTAPVLITVNNMFSSALLDENITIYENTATNLNVAINGGTPPYTIEYTRNSVPQSTIYNYSSGSDIYTGILPGGTYTYSLTSVTDALGCHPQNLGNPMTVTSSGVYTGTSNRKAIVLVNSLNTSHYPHYNNFIKPYLNWFGIPYDVCDVSNTPLPVLRDYAVIIFGHRNVYTQTSDYPVTALEAAISVWGVGLYSFDPRLFDITSGFNVLGATNQAVTSTQINILPIHYITQLHQNDIYHPTNNIIQLRNFGGQQTISVSQTDYNLVGGISLANISNAGVTEPLLEVTEYGFGKIVKWNSYDWVFDEKLGPMWGMDDLLWRGIVWAAKKPFIMQGFPPMITMRVDDVDGTRSMGMPELEWLTISNELGFIPWCATFTESQFDSFFSMMRGLVNNNQATASPHAFSYDDFIYYNLNELPVFDAAENVRRAAAIYADSGLTISKYFVPHWYLLAEESLIEIRNMGVEFIGTKIPYDPVPYPGQWLQRGPYRINRSGWGGQEMPLFYADSITWVGNQFFICMTEIGDDGGYEWFPTSDIASTTATGVRHLRRALDAMVIPTLFTHEDQLNMSPQSWRQILGGVLSAISSYNPEQRSLDYAAQYARAKVNLKITNVVTENNLVSITFTGINDMATKCYLFTETNDQISYRLISLPLVNSITVPVTVGVSSN